MPFRALAGLGALERLDLAQLAQRRRVLQGGVVEDAVDHRLGHVLGPARHDDAQH